MSIHIGKKIKEIFENSGISVSELARRIKTTRQNIYGIFERSSLDTALLLRLGEALNYNFFQYFTAQSIEKAEEPSSAYQKKEKKRKIILQIEIEDEKQDAILKLALGDNAYEILKKSFRE